MHIEIPCSLTCSYHDDVLFTYVSRSSVHACIDIVLHESWSINDTLIVICWGNKICQGRPRLAAKIGLGTGFGRDRFFITGRIVAWLCETRYGPSSEVHCEPVKFHLMSDLGG